MKRIIFLISLILIVFSNILSAQHLKKDGTPDMRYKENKSTYTIPSSTPSYSIPFSSKEYNSSSHLKKDGTPDRRYKENRSSTNSGSSYNSYKKSPKHSSKYIYSLERDKHGRIKRSESAKRKFLKESGFPKGREGYVVDHIIPLKKGGCDCPRNMQWQTKADAKLKDKWE